MSKGKIKFVMFSIGALGYGLLEVLWRGYTHWSMLTAGGICFVAFGRIGEKFKSAGLIIKGIVGSAVVTSVEFVFGIIFNVILKKNVWDYSKLPLNIGGQICAVYSFIWMLLSIVCIPFASLVTKKLKNQ
ncbi:MAG: hypothetical protein IJ432_04840 [Clostridia bacterium]|nr:hypothetical protein [Clostridia bacterium]MEE1055599.1 hypothetical protein [Acutalibacteraceae bacterium]